MVCFLWLLAVRERLHLLSNSGVLFDLLFFLQEHTSYQLENKMRQADIHHLDRAIHSSVLPCQEYKN